MRPLGIRDGRAAEWTETVAGAGSLAAKPARPVDGLRTTDWGFNDGSAQAERSVGSDAERRPDAPTDVPTAPPPGIVAVTCSAARTARRSLDSLAAETSTRLQTGDVRLVGELS